MSTARTDLPGALTPQESAAILRQILAAVEHDQRGRWVQITCAVVLSLATMSTAWCAYQAQLWGGVQTFRLAAANQASRDSAAATATALQLKAFDASMFISYINAKNEGNERQEQFLLQRFRPELKAGVEAWLKTNPFNDPKAPQGPFRMAEYSQPELEVAKRHEEQSAQESAAAQAANGNSDTYVLLTVLFASVLFFGGIAGTLDSHRLRVIILGIAMVFFLVTLVVLGTMPICHE